MRKLLFCITMMLTLGMNNSTAYAQSFTRNGKTFKQTPTKGTVKKDTLLTSYTFEDSKGISYPIVINRSSGRCYIWKKSGKTHRLYKMYMKEEISRQICKELGVIYKTK